MLARGTTRFADAEALEAWLEAELADHTFVAARRTGSSWEVELEVALEDDDDEHADDDLARPLWLLPIVDRVQRVILRAAAFEETCDTDDPTELADGGRVDEVGAWAEDGLLAVRLRLPDRELVLRGAAIEAVASAPTEREGDAAYDPDVVTLQFRGPIAWATLVRGLATDGIDARLLEPPAAPDRASFELTRLRASPEAFVVLLRRLAERPDFLGASSEDSIFPSDSLLDYVTPGRRPW